MIQIPKSGSVSGLACGLDVDPDADPEVGLPSDNLVEARMVLAPAQRRLRNAGIDSAALDARLLLGLALGRDDAVLPHETIMAWTSDRDGVFDDLINRRLAGEPVSRIRGWREFWSLRFSLSPETLDPRPDSETLVAAALSWADGRRDDALRILDLGTGSGALVLACLSELPMASGVGVDINSGAVRTSNENAERLGLAGRVSFMTGDFADPDLGGDNFDMILCNPPYIPHARIGGLAPEVSAFDPAAALDGGEDGLESWRRLMPRIAGGLAPEGRAFVEIGDGQQVDVTRLAGEAGLHPAGDAVDLSGIVRCLVLALEP